MWKTLVTASLITSLVSYCAAAGLLRQLLGDRFSGSLSLSSLLFKLRIKIYIKLFRFFFLPSGGERVDIKDTDQEC